MLSSFVDVTMKMFLSGSCCFSEEGSSRAIFSIGLFVCSLIDPSPRDICTLSLLANNSKTTENYYLWHNYHSATNCPRSFSHMSEPPQIP